MSTSTSNKIRVETSGLRKNTAKSSNCLICGKFTHFKYYTVRSCNGCKQFFRRIVLNQTQYFCLFDGKCDLTKVKCRGCRLDKCLRLMNPASILKEDKIETNQIINSLEARRKILLMDQSKKLNRLVNSRCGQELELDCNQIKYLTKILNAHRRINDRYFDLPDSYLNKFKSIEEIFDGQDNILSLANCYSPYIDPSSVDENAQIDREVIEMGINEMHPKLRKIHIVFHLAVVGFLKAMPFFAELTLKDKEILIRGLGHQINNLTNSYYTVERLQMSAIGPKGFPQINAYIEVYKAMPRVKDMWNFVFIHPKEAFRRIPLLSNEEFALLIAICSSNSAISGLSSHAREVLYKEQCKYSQLLLKYCQNQAGNEVKGAQRYAECLQLIECAFQAVRYFELILTYGEMFLARKNYFDNIPSEYVIKSLMK